MPNEKPESKSSPVASPKAVETKLPGPIDPAIIKPNPPIFVLAEKMPLEPTPGQNPVYTACHRLGYWTDEGLAGAHAKRYGLTVLKIEDGEAR